jgi:cephalosporin-C deacetylase
MPTIDMPLEQLKQYTGRNPRPDDFDTYWERALSEMKAVDPQVELVKSSFSVPYAECYDLYFTGVGGARIHSKYVKPTHVQEPHPAVVQFHGYSGNAGDWSDKLIYASLGYSIAAMDCRG